MIDRNKLNRIKGILSAKRGAEIPKYNNGAKFAKAKGEKIIYSGDGIMWYSDINLTTPHFGGIEGFSDVSTPDVQQAFEIPGDQNLTPNSAIENAASQNQAVEHKIQETTVQRRADSTPLAEIKTPNISIERALNATPLQNKLKNQVNEELDKISKGMYFTNQVKLEEQNKKNANIVKAVGIGTDVFKGVGDAFGAQQSITDSTLTKGIDVAYNMAADTASQFGPVGQFVGTAMKMASTAGNILQGMGGGTDQMTATDKWMDSPVFSWWLGAANGFGGKKSESFGVDQNIMSQVGSSYGGSASELNDAANKAGKKYGLFSSGARRRANAAIADARKTQSAMGNIADSANDQRMFVQSMGEQAGLNYSLMMDGGYNQKYTYAAKQGGILEWNPTIELEWQPQVKLNWELPKFKEGGNIDIVEELEWIPEMQNGGKVDLSKVLDYYNGHDLKGVNFIKDSQARAEGNNIYYSNEEDAVHELWHYISKNNPNKMYEDFYKNLNDDVITSLGGDLQFVKRIDGDPGHFYHPSELEARIKAAKFMTPGEKYTIQFFKNLRSNENKYGYNMRDLLHMYNDENLEKIFNLKKGGSLGKSDIPEIEETTQKNVIPEGALHKNKHHMEHAEGLTKKGIPVIDEEGEQQAEIEHSEIIFTLEVTKKLEEYYEIFYSDEATNKEKEQAAIDVGKLLVYQILENTEDRTGLIESCKKGGSLTLKKSTDDLIEEVLDWMPTIIVVEEEEKPKKKSEKDQMKEAIKEVLIELLVK